MIFFVKRKCKNLLNCEIYKSNRYESRNYWSKITLWKVFCLTNLGTQGITVFQIPRVRSKGILKNLDVVSSQPRAVAGSKGKIVHLLRWYVRWVQNVVRQFGFYPQKMTLKIDRDFNLYEKIVKNLPLVYFLSEKSYVVKK